MICTRHPLIPSTNDPNPHDLYILAPSDESDENIYELDYFLLELRLIPNLGFTHQVSYDYFRSQVYYDRVTADLESFLQYRSITEDEISFMDDGHGPGHYYRRTHLPPHETLAYQLIILSDDVALQTVLLNTCNNTGGQSRF